MKQSIILYHCSFDHFGGVETFCVAFCKRLEPYFDITFLSPSIKHPNIFKMAGYCHIDTWTPNATYKADICIFATAWGKIPYNITSTQTIQMVHADYDAYIKGWHFTYKRHPQTTHHVCVGKHVAKAFTLATGFKADAIIHNMLPDLIQYPKQENSELTLISATRLSKEKGIERMIELSHAITIPYKWYIYGSLNSHYGLSMAKKFPPSCILKGYSNNILPEIAKADYLVQLSDTEGFPYATYEALHQRTPVIVTDFPSAKEQVTDGVNGYILDMDLKNWKKILKKKIKFSNFVELSTQKDWVNFLHNGSKS